MEVTFSLEENTIYKGHNYRDNKTMKEPAVQVKNILTDNDADLCLCAVACNVCYKRS